LLSFVKTQSFEVTKESKTQGEGGLRGGSEGQNEIKKKEKGVWLGWGGF